MKLNLKIEPIGVIKKCAMGLADILIYSDYENILRNMKKKPAEGTSLIIVHKGIKALDEHQVEVSSAELINRNGNILRVKGLEAENDSLIDIRLV
jgi:hypothetical protein